MSIINLKNIGRKTKEKRGARGLREAAKDIGVSPATLSRIENGKVPDLDTFGKLCKWLELDPATVMGLGATKPQSSASEQIRVHFRKEDAVNPETAQALASMILAAQRAIQSRNG